VFSDQIILPSPTSPNNPPIIHQPAPPGETGETVGKIITPTWSNQPAPAPAQPQLCRIGESGKAETGRERLSPDPDPVDRSGLSKLISNVKRTPSLAAADKSTGKEKESKAGSLPRKAKPDRSSLRNLEISAPILQGDVEHKADLVPVCRSPDTAVTSSPTPGPGPRHGSPSMKRPAPPPPTKPALAAKSADISAAEKSPEKTKSSKFSLPWRSNPGKANEEAGESQEESLVHKVSSSDDILGYKKPEVKPERSSGRSRRPASIATSKPTRPNAPPPKPPPSRAGSKESSPEDVYIYDDACAARARPAGPPEPIYDTITEAPEQEEFSTPAGSPNRSKKSPDTISNGSSAAEEDLMKEILKEMHSKTEGESIYSSLMRKDKKNRKKKPISSE